jgi:hypothetical protein
MASPKLARYFRQERLNPRTWRAGFNAIDAYDVAVTRVKFEALEDLGCVRMNVVDDDDPDLSFLDQDCFNDTRGGIAATKKTREIARDEGVFGLVAEFTLDPLTDPESPVYAGWEDRQDWNHGGSCFGFIGYKDADPRTNCYAPQIMAETIAAFRDAWKAHVRANRKATPCPKCQGSGTLPWNQETLARFRVNNPKGGTCYECHGTGRVS